MDPSQLNKDSALMNPEIRQQFQQLDEARKQLMNKRSEMDQEIKEHDLVLGAFSKVEEGRKCYRMVGGVLMERTVGEVGPALEYEFVFSVVIFLFIVACVYVEQLSRIQVSFRFWLIRCEPKQVRDRL